MSFSDLTLFSLGALLVLAGCSGEGMVVGSGPAKPASTDTSSSGPAPGTSTTPGDSTNTPDPAATAGDLVVFTTRSTFAADFGGLDGADDRCTTYANAAGWKGKFRAWLSDKSTDAITRIPQGGPWRVVSSEGTLGSIAFADHDAWTGYPAISLSADEFGKIGTSTSTFTWTATMLGGKHLGCACANWSTTSDYDYSCSDSSGYGAYTGLRSAERGDEGWTNYGEQSCYTKQSLICYQL